MGYPFAEGRLYTRYAPVRHSSSSCKQEMLPFDLHVLSLPLAFILSQDQTLRCNKLNCLSRIFKYLGDICLNFYAFQLFKEL